MGSSRYGPRDGPAARRCFVAHAGTSVGCKRGGRRAPPPWWTKKSVGNGGGVLSLRRRRKHLSNSRETLLLRGRWLEKGPRGLPSVAPARPSIRSNGIGRWKRRTFYFVKKKITWCPPNTKKTRPTPFIIILRDTQDVKESWRRSNSTPSRGGHYLTNTPTLLLYNQQQQQQDNSPSLINCYNTFPPFSSLMCKQ